MHTMPPRSEMVRAYLERDPSYRGLFVFAVRTTGIFCRPTCPARKPLPANVLFFATPAEARAAGFRPCKRCRPLDTDDQPAWARTLLAEIEAVPHRRITAAQLRARRLDPATVRRHFQRHYGMSFHALARARRLAVAHDQIRENRPVDDALFSSGFESHSGFREAFTQAFGAPPGRLSDTAALRLAWFPSPLGPLVAGATTQGVCLLEFTDRIRLDTQLITLRRLFGTPATPGPNPHLDRLRDELDRYFAGTLREFTIPLDAPGTPFQTRVWNQLRQIPYGTTCCYEQLATAIGAPAAIRAVGRANGSNRIAIVIPCHRVVAKNGTLGGYAAGLARKQFLLDLEGSSFP